MDYYGWLNSLVEILVKELEEELGKDFIYDWEMALAAAKHSEAMIWRGYCYHAPKEYWGAARAELAGDAFTSYNDWAIERAIKSIAQGFMASPDHHPFLRLYSVIGGGIAFGQTGREGEIRIYVTVRLRN